MRSVRNRARRRAPPPVQRVEDKCVLHACYDLARNPPTYDAVAFLAHAELARLSNKADCIFMHVLSGPDNGFRRDNLWPRTLEQRERMRDGVLIPLCRLLPSIRSIDFVRGKASLDGWGRGGYRVGLSSIVAALKAGCKPLRAAPAPRQHRPVITFTLREAEHHKRRNSNVRQWIEAARRLQKSLTDKDIIIIRDTEKALEPIEGVLTDSKASIDLMTRAALYSSAHVNVGISNGPMWMAIFMDAPTIMLRPTTNAAGGCYDDNFFMRHGVPPGSQLPMSGAHQKLIWENDSADNIVRAIEEFFG